MLKVINENNTIPVIVTDEQGNVQTFRNVEIVADNHDDSMAVAARKAKELGLKYFTTTLASSRWKSLEQIERAGRLAEQTINGISQKGQSPLCDSVTFWAQNWRKGGLYERRNQLLKEFDFYNQQYCGCEYSFRQKNISTKD